MAPPAPRRSRLGRAPRAAAPLALALALATAGAPARAAGQQRASGAPRDSTVVPVEAVVVQAVRAVTTAGGASALVVRPESLHVAPAPTLDAVLRELPFVHVRANSRGEAELSVRGSESRQVAVLVDGVPLSLGWDHRSDPSLIPLTGTESVLLVRGLHSVLHGPNVLGGVVEVGVSPEAVRSLPSARTRVQAGADHLGGWALGVTGVRPAELPSGDLLLRAGAGFRARPGVALPAGIDQPEPLAGARRANSDLSQVDGFLGARFHRHDGAWMSLSSSGYHARRGVPPELHLSQPRFWRYPRADRLLAVVSGGTGQRRTALGEGDLEASLGLDLGATEIESFAGGTYQQVTGGEQSTDRTVTLRLLGDHSLGRGATLHGAFTLSDVRHREQIDAGARLQYRQRLWSLGSEVTLPVTAATRLSGGLVLDAADTPESGDKPPLDRLAAWGGRLGASHLTLDGDLLLHAAVSRRARFPSLRELYSGALGRFVPNPALRPETLLGAEVGATAQRPDLELQAVLFHHRLDDAIVRVGAGQGRFRRDNRDQIRSTGVELLGEWTPGRLSLAADLLLQNVRVLDPGATYARHAEYQPAVRAGLNAALPLPARVRGTLGATLTGRQFCVHPEAGREMELGATARLDAGLERGWTTRRLGRLRTRLSLDNVTDSAIYDQCGLPQPGRTLRFAVEIG